MFIFQVKAQKAGFHSKLTPSKNTFACALKGKAWVLEVCNRGCEKKI